MSEHHAEPKWRPISTAPRECGAEILTWDGTAIRVATYAWDVKWQTPGLPAHQPTHWLPLPTAPCSQSPGLSANVSQPPPDPSAS
jgi:hypothetical protein